MQNINHRSSPAGGWSYIPTKQEQESLVPHTQVLTLKNLAALQIFHSLQLAELSTTGTPIVCDEAYNDKIQELPLPPVLKEEMASKPITRWTPIQAPDNLEGIAIRKLDEQFKKKWLATHPVAEPSRKDFLWLVPDSLRTVLPTHFIMLLRREKLYKD